MVGWYARSVVSAAHKGGTVDNTTYKTVAGIVGSADVHIDAFEGLICWLVPEKDGLIIVSASLPGKYREWCDLVNQDYKTVNSDAEVVESLADMSEKVPDVALVVLGIEGNEDLVRKAWDKNIEVLDMVRALYPVTKGDDLRDALYEPVTQAYEISDGLGGRGSLDIFAPQEPAQSRTEAHEHKPYEACYPDCPEPRYTKEKAEERAAKWYADDRAGAVKELAMTGRGSLFGMEHTEQEILEIMAGMIKTHEEKYHGNHVPVITGVAVNAMSEIPVEDNTDKVRCIVGASGKIRVSPRAKLKNGEREIWLHPEEIDD